MVQANPFGPSLGKSAEARRSFEKGLTVMTDPPINLKTLPTALRIQVESQMEALEARIGDNLQYGGSITAAKKAYQSALARAMEVRRLSPGPSSARTLAAAQQRLGGLALRFRDAAAARQHYEAALTLVEEIDGVEKSSASRDAVISARNGLADVLSLLGDHRAAEQHWRLILANNERLVSESRNAGSLQNLTHAYRQYSHVKANLGEYEEAIRYARKAIAVSEELTLADPKDIQALRLLALAHMALAGNQEFVDREAALRSYQQGLVYTRKVLAADPANVDAQVDELSNQLNIARAHVLQSRFQQAVEPLRVALDQAESLIRKNPDRNYLIAYHARALSYRAEALLGIGDRRRALESIEAAYRIASANENASVANLRREWIRALALRGRIQLAFAGDGTLDMAARRKHALAARESLEQAHKVFPVPGTGSRLPDLKTFYDRLLNDLDRARQLATELGGS